jgi:hypothetical protein
MPSSSFFLRSSVTLVSALSLIAVPVSAGFNQVYQLDTAYNGSAFFEGMDFFNVRLIWKYLLWISTDPSDSLLILVTALSRIPTRAPQSVKV